MSGGFLIVMSNTNFNCYILLFFIFHIQIRHHCFSTLTHQNHGKHKTNKIVILNKVSSNEGNAYNATSGILTAPVDGICSFSWKILTNGGKYSSLTLCSMVDQLHLNIPIIKDGLNILCHLHILTLN